MTHLIKAMVGMLAMPFTILLLIAGAGVVLRILGRRRAAAWLLTAAAGAAYLFAIEPVGDLLLIPLERKYPPLRQDIRLPAVGYIVVLGASYEPHVGIPITAALNEDGLARIVEGLRLARHLSSARIIVSGGAPPGRAPPALGYAELAREFGVAEPRLVVSNGPLDTRAEAWATARMLGQTPFILVTSAYHMPRAVWLMERAGARPIPAPTQQMVSADRNLLHDLLPSSGGLRKTERSFHEYVGLAALALGLD